MSDSNIQKIDKEEEAQEQELTVAQKFWRIFELLLVQHLQQCTLLQIKW